MVNEDVLGAPGRWAVVRDLTAVCLDLTDGGVFDDAAIAIGAPDQAPLVLASSTSRARTMLEWEAVCGEGAAWEAWRVRGAAVIRDLTDPVVGRHWPAYSTGAAERGVVAAAAVPLAVGSSVLGVLAGFSSRPIDIGAEHLARLGVHIVVGHHPHVVQPVTMVGDTLVIYSLGNFLSAQKELFKLVGLLVSLDVVKTETPHGVKISLENVTGTLLYNPRRSPLGRYVVVPFDMMTEEILKDYITVHGRFSAYVKKDDTIDITPPAQVREADYSAQVTPHRRGGE